MDKILNLVPEGFYETVAYIVPAAYFMTGLFLIFWSPFGVALPEILLAEKWPTGIIWITIAIAMLFTVGQQMNSAGHYLFYIGAWKAAFRMKQLSKEWINCDISRWKGYYVLLFLLCIMPYIFWWKPLSVWKYIKGKTVDISPEPWKLHDDRWRTNKNKMDGTTISGALTKVRLKWIMSLNIAFASFALLILMIVSPIFSFHVHVSLSRTYALIMAVMVASLTDAHKRFGDERDFLTNIEDSLRMRDSRVLSGPTLPRK